MDDALIFLYLSPAARARREAHLRQYYFLDCGHRLLFAFHLLLVGPPLLHLGPKTVCYFDLLFRFNFDLFCASARDRYSIRSVSASRFPSSILADHFKNFARALPETAASPSRLARFHPYGSCALPLRRHLKGLLARGLLFLLVLL